VPNEEPADFQANLSFFCMALVKCVPAPESIVPPTEHEQIPIVTRLRESATAMMNRIAKSGSA
jgi:hypothetical protein